MIFRHFQKGEIKFLDRTLSRQQITQQNFPDIADRTRLNVSTKVGSRVLHSQDKPLVGSRKRLITMCCCKKTAFKSLRYYSFRSTQVHVLVRENTNRGDIFVNVIRINFNKLLVLCCWNNTNGVEVIQEFTTPSFCKR